MTKAEVLAALEAAEQACEQVEIWGFGPNGFGPLPKNDRPKYQAVPMVRGKLRKHSKEYRKKFGGIV